MSKRLDELQDKIVKILDKNSEENGKKEKGIIGASIDHPVKAKPSRIYWNGLRISGILTKD